MLDAVQYLRGDDRFSTSASAPLGFVPPGWKRPRDGSIDKIVATAGKLTHPAG
jgi:hypothetical protein